jgi:hypothetical protein
MDFVAFGAKLDPAYEQFSKAQWPKTFAIATPYILTFENVRQVYDKVAWDMRVRGSHILKSPLYSSLI